MRALLACVPALASMRPRPPLVFQHNDLLPGPAIGAAVRAAARRAQLTVCLSRAIARDLDPDGRLGRVEVLPAGVDLERFAPAPGARAGDEVLVLGAIESWKRPELALEIAVRGSPSFGCGWPARPSAPRAERCVERLSERVRRPDLAGRVELAGPLADSLPALQGAAALLHCADREPYGLALVEALACGVPVVAPAAGGPLEIVGEGGRLYPPGDAGAAALVLRDVLARRDELGAAARRRAEAHFDREQARRRYRELLATAA